MQQRNSSTPSVFLSSGHKGWIMDALARESANAMHLSPNYHYLPVSRRELWSPSSVRTYFFPRFSSTNVFMHHNTYIYLQRKYDLRRYWNSVFVTHFESDSVGELQSLEILKKVNRILVQNKTISGMLYELGIDPNKIRIVYGAVNRSQYFPRLWSQISQPPFILIVGDCKPRKNPQLIEKVIDALPDIKFIIHGKNWETYTTLALKPRKNVELIKFQLNLNPELMRTAATVLSLAQNEGGPIPLLEALASGTPIVATDTGFSSDFINDSNGVLLEIDSSMSEIKEAIFQAMSLKQKVSEIDLLNGQLTWEDLGQQIYFNEGRN